MSIYDKDGNALTACYDKDGNALLYAYDKDGSTVFVGRDVVPDYDNYTISDYLSINISNVQGFDIYNNTLFQMRGAFGSVYDIMNVYDATNGSLITKGVSIESEHGNTVSFSTEFYDESDDFPLLYVSNNADSSSTTASVNRVTTTSSTLIKILFFPLEVSGYYAHPCYDFENGIAYVLGYVENSNTNEKGGANKVIVTSWDLNDLTDNEDGTYTPAFISSYQRDFIYCIQGQQFRDGVCWMASGYTDASFPQMVYGIDALTGEMLYEINTGLNIEIEGISFLDDYHMVAGFRLGTYKLLTFGEKTSD